MKKLLLSGMVGLSCLVGATDAERLQQAAQLLQVGEAGQAYELLLAQYDPQQADNQELFLLGMTAKESGKLEDAQGYFEALLAREPDAARVKLELAEVVYEQGGADYARSLLLEVRATNPPERVLQNINGFIAQIEHPNLDFSNKRVYWGAWGEVGFIVDSNANAAPLVDTVTMYNIPFTLSDDAKQTSDTAKVVNVGLNNAIALSDNSRWLSRLSLQWQDYAKLSQLDSLQLTVQSGPSIGLSSRLMVDLPLTANRVRFGHEDSYYYYSYGVSPRLSYQATPKLNLYASLNAAVRKYRQNRPDVRIYSFSPSLQYAFNEKSLLGFGLSVGREDSAQAWNSNRSVGVFSQFRHAFNDDFSAYVSAGYEQQSYDGREPAFATTRKDNLFNIGAGLNYHVKPLGADLNLSISHNHNDSNLTLYDYKRTQVYLNLRKQF